MFGFVRRFFIRRSLKKVLPEAIRLQKWQEEHPRQDMRYTEYLNQLLGVEAKK